MARRIREHDWEPTELGASHAWPAALRSAIEFVLPSPIPMLVSWAEPPALFYNDAFIPIAGLRHPGILGRSVQRHWPEVAAQAVSVISRIETGESVVLRGPILDVLRDGQQVRETFDVAYWPLRASDGGYHGLMGAVTRAAVLEDEAAALLRQTRFREFADASPDVLWILDAETLALEYAGPAYERLFGLAPIRTMSERGVAVWLDLVVDEDRPGVVAAYNRTRQGERVRHEYRIRRAGDGEERWIGATDFPLFDAPGPAAHIGGIASDITEAKRSLARNEILVAELQHRSRNLLAVVAAIASRTLRLGGDYAAFESRLAALSRAQGLLGRDAAETVDVGDLVRGELAAHAEAGAGRARVSGPPAPLAAHQVQTLTLVLHELTTNAVKYGALAQPQARLDVEWRIEHGPGSEDRLRLAWRESGVRIEATNRRGFGRELIERVAAGAPGARTHYTIGQDGVACELEIAL
ncbi:MAG TPA: HWE histidine kinase domain-containing protein [Caulobacteraceae bacterium]|jgi:two-component system CheB/CheR fusion protein|nr:HWE histidine kinase domain-containing protein [Caulobacteraceae bacterium]